MYLSQGVDYLGFLNAKLRDLKGWATLANELIQNADDASGATRIALDLTDDAMTVSNDAQFTDCGAVIKPQCAWDIAGDGRKCCDFHAFRRVASGHKRQEEDTTGAFGIGFISVYQITDRPSLRSGRWHWKLNPEASEGERILAEEAESPLGETRFEFPWAREQNALRARLGIEPVPTDVALRMSEELRAALVRAAPFLKRLELLELRRNGGMDFRVECDRDTTSDDILVVANGQSRIWKRLTGAFDQRAVELKSKFGVRIEAKRKSAVTVAVPLDEVPENGLLYAALPTEHQVGLPLLINADFYPSTDRKRILFDADYQGAWNRAAIEAAADAFASSLPKLCGSLKPVDLWQLLSKAQTLAVSVAAGGPSDASFGAFWAKAKPVVQAGELVFMSTESFCTPQAARLNGASKEAVECLPLFEALNLSIVHADLRPYYNVLKEVGVLDLDLDALTSAFHAMGLTDQRDVADVPEWLRSPAHRQSVAQLIDVLLGRVPKDKLAGAQERLLDCSVWLTVGGAVAPASWLWRGDAATRSLFGLLDSDDMWVADDNPDALSRLADAFDLAAAAEVLEGAGAERLQALHSARPGWVTDLIAWIDDRHAELGLQPQLKTRFRALPIWPSGGVLRALDGLSVPGDFADPLKLAQVLDSDVGGSFRTLLLTHLGAKPLDLKTYLTDQVPAAFALDPRPAPETKRALVHLLARHIGQIRDDEAVQRKLRELPLAECEDGEFRLPRLVYLKSPELGLIFGSLGARYIHPSSAGSPGLVDALRWLGISDAPEPLDITLRVDELLRSEPGAAREAMRSLFRGLVDFWPKLVERRDELIELKAKSWLPTSKGTSWLPPTQVYTGFRDFLFQSQAQFLDVPRPVQALAQQRPASGGESLIEFLGIRGEPTSSQVVEHLLHEAKSNAKVNLEVFAFLEQHHADPAIRKLRDQSCLPIEGKGYIKPAQALRGQHAFGRFRHLLAPEWFRFSNLLGVLDVPQEPTAAEAIAVLQELADDYADRRQLSDDDFAINLYCWTLLSAAGGDDHLDRIAKLNGLTVVPSAKRFLRRPDGVFFEDRPGLAGKFDDAVQNHTIRKPEGAWVAMALAGVRDLSKVVETRVVECLDPQESAHWSGVLGERWPLVRRVMASLQEQRPDACPTEPPDVWDSNRLMVCYALGDRVTVAEAVTAILDPESSRLYVVNDRRGVEAAIARELAFMMQPDAGAGLLAAALKELLTADTIAEAAAALSDLGFADVMLGDGAGTSGAPAVGLDATMSPPQGDGDGQPSTTGPDAGIAPTPDSSATGQGGVTGQGGTGVGAAGGPTGPEGGTNGGGNSGTGRPTHGGGAGGTKSPRGEKFVGKSFVQPAREAGDDATDGSGNDRQLDVDRRGTEHVLAHERQQGRDPRKMDHFNEGYDIESLGGDGSVERYIEVKSLSAPWNKSSVMMTPAQFSLAGQKGAQFWLYVVDDLESGKPGLHMIPDPATKVAEYRFDDGWRQAAESKAAPARRSLLTAVAPKRSDVGEVGQVDAKESS